MNILLKECIEALASDIDVLNEDESRTVYRRFQDAFQFVGLKQPWEWIEGAVPIKELKELPIDIKGSNCFILWSSSGRPVIRTNMNLVITNFDDVSAVDFDKYFCGLDYSWMLGVYSDDRMGYVIR